MLNLGRKDLRQRPSLLIDTDVDTTIVGNKCICPKLVALICYLARNFRVCGRGLIGVGMFIHFEVIELTYIVVIMMGSIQPAIYVSKASRNLEGRWSVLWGRVCLWFGGTVGARVGRALWLHSRLRGNELSASGCMVIELKNTLLRG